MNGTIKVICVACLICISSHGAFAEHVFYDGNYLLEVMQEYHKYQRLDRSANYVLAGRFVGYVGGVADAVAGTLCPPKGATAGQYASIVTQYMIDHPEEWAFPAHEIVAKALRQAFPCQ